MKKSIVITLSFIQLFLLSPLSAQEKMSSKGLRDQPWKRKIISQITPEVAVTATSFEGSIADDVQPLTAIGAGARVDIGRDQLVFETGFGYRRFGAVTSYKNTAYATETQYKLDYFILPLMGKYYFTNRSDSTFFVRAGVVPAYLFHKEATTETEGRPARTEYDIPTREMDVFAAGGFGVNIYLNPTSFAVIEGTYMRGLSPVMTGSNLYNSGFSGQIGLGIFL